MQQNFQVTKAPTDATTADAGGHGTPATWTDPLNILANDSDYAYFAAFEPGQASSITGLDFDFVLPPGAAIDGIQVILDGSQTGCYGDITLNVAGTTGKPISAMNGSYGGSNDLWGATEIDVADVTSLAVSATPNDISGGDGYAAMQYMSVTVYYHIDLKTAPANVPTRVAYKVYSREGHFLGELPNVNTPFAFPQDINAAGSTIQITCASTITGGVVTEPLLTEAGDPLLTENDQEILASVTTNVIARGDSDDEVIFKNSNRVKVWVYNYWHPNGKLVFSGQVNRVGFQYGGGTTAVQLTVISDGLDLTNFIARGFPFEYTDDQSQLTENGYVTVMDSTISGWIHYGQSFTTGAAVSNVGAIALLMQGSAQVTVSLYDAPNGNFLGSVTKNVADGGATVEQFNFPQLIGVPPSTERFFGITVQAGQSINVYRNDSAPYVDGWMYISEYSGGSGGGSYSEADGDLYFVTKTGVPTTSITFTGKDPVTEMASNVLADYNTRGGYIHERDFQATGLSLTYPFNMATIFDVIKKAIELSPTGYYSYVDVGTAEIDILPMSTTADFTVVLGRDINQLNLALSIEQVKNYLLFTGGEVSGTNLFREYPDPESAAFYGPRYTPKSDNRVVLDATANAIGETFIEENSDETQETTLTILNTTMDISLLTPGKTIGFRNSGGFIDEMILPIVRAEPNYSVGLTALTLGRLPVRMNDEVQRINRELQNEQTANNPSAPS